MKLYNIEILYKYYMYVANDEIKKMYATASWKVNDKSLDDKFDSKKVTVQCSLTASILAGWQNNDLNVQCAVCTRFFYKHWDISQGDIIKAYTKQQSSLLEVEPIAVGFAINPSTNNRSYDRFQIEFYAG